MPDRWGWWVVGWVAVGLGNFYWVEGNCIWDPRKKFQANCFENGRVIAISLSLPTIIYHSISPPIIISHSISSPTIPYHNISPPIIIYHHRSFLDTSMMLRTHQKKFQLNWLIHDWDNELRNLGAIQVYPMLSPKSGGRVVKSFTINWTLLHCRLPTKNFSSIGQEIAELWSILFLPKNSREGVKEWKTQ